MKNYNAVLFFYILSVSSFLVDNAFAGALLVENIKLSLIDLVLDVVYKIGGSVVALFAVVSVINLAIKMIRKGLEDRDYYVHGKPRPIPYGTVPYRISPKKSYRSK